MLTNKKYQFDKPLIMRADGSIERGEDDRLEGDGKQVGKMCIYIFLFFDLILNFFVSRDGLKWTFLQRFLR